MMSFDSLLAVFYTLVGVAAFIALITNVLKVVGWVKDGTAPIWAAGFNLVALILLYLGGILKPGFDLAGVDAILGQAAAIGMLLLEFIVQILASRGVHWAVKGLPLIGKSFTTDRAKAATNGTPY
jgi:hypothetical protein